MKFLLEIKVYSPMGSSMERYGNRRFSSLDPVEIEAKNVEEAEKIAEEEIEYMESQTEVLKEAFFRDHDEDEEYYSDYSYTITEVKENEDEDEG